MRVHWTNKAITRLKQIQEYIAEDSPNAALQIIERVISRSEQIAELPYSGHQVPEYKRNDIREIKEKPFRIIYIIKSDQIDVLTVMHYRQLLPQDTKKL